MSRFDTFFLMNTEDAKDYAVEVLHIFASAEGLECREIGDGNINYVFRVFSPAEKRSVIIKQADQLLRSSGRPLDTYRSKIEACILRLQAELAPGQVPEVYHYNETMCALSMEDISAYRNLRKELNAGRLYPHLAESLSSFLANTLLPSTDLVLDRGEKKRRVQFFTNPELCDITEDLVLTEPYYDYKQRNILFPGNEDFVARELYEDQALHAAVAALRDTFMNRPQALLHGDLHTGSIFVNEHGIKVIDPEFAFYGPMGYDIGNVIANLFFAYARLSFCAAASISCLQMLDELENTIADCFDRCFEKLDHLYGTRVCFPLYRAKDFREGYLRQIKLDSLGYTGTELIRRVVGDAKVMDVCSVTDPKLRIPLERTLIRFGKRLILDPGYFSSGDKLIDAFQEIKHGTNG